jgi:RNA polymerase sigma-70 factor (ECF subfamily)
LVNNLEPQLLQLALQGDDAAFSRLVETYQTPVYNLCYRMLGDEVEAEDAAQETFWRAYQNLRRYDAQRSLTTWLLSIAAHYCIDQQRKRKHGTVPIDEYFEETFSDPAPSPEKAYNQLDQNRFLHQLMNQMPPQDRAVLVLRYWHELSEEEIASALEMTVSAVKSRLHRARLQLAKRWQTAQTPTLLPERNQHESPAL